MDSIQDVVNRGMCISCGLCAGVAPKGAVVLREDRARGMILPQVHPNGEASGKGLEFQVCPGKGYPIVAMGRECFPQAPHHDEALGFWIEACAARATESGYLKKASSGGIMTRIATYLLETGAVQGAVVTVSVYGSPGPRNQPIIARSPRELFAAQGSKYCPVPALQIQPQIEAFDGSLVFVGTPCQVAALRLLQASKPDLKEKIPFTISNFCGGFRDLRETDAIIRRCGIDPARVVDFSYRGRGQPGSMQIVEDTGKTVTLPYPGYARLTGYIKHLRCRLCVDATAELADFACGDAWIPRFLQRGEAWSLLITRSPQAQQVASAMFAADKMIREPVTIDEIKKSQHHNLLSKKHRQNARRRMMRLFGSTVPGWDGGFPVTGGGLALEFKVHLSHSLFALLEAMGLYPWVARLLGRTGKNTRDG